MSHILIYNIQMQKSTILKAADGSLIAAYIQGNPTSISLN